MEDHRDVCSQSLSGREYAFRFVMEAPAVGPHVDQPEPMHDAPTMRIDRHRVVAEGVAENAAGGLYPHPRERHQERLGVFSLHPSEWGEGNSPEPLFQGLRYLLDRHSALPVKACLDDLTGDFVLGGVEEGGPGPEPGP